MKLQETKRANIANEETVLFAETIADILISELRANARTRGQRSALITEMDVRDCLRNRGIKNPLAMVPFKLIRNIINDIPGLQAEITFVEVGPFEDMEVLTIGLSA